MKKIKALIGVFLFSLLTHMPLKAQTTIDLHFYDSTSSHCVIPANGEFFGYVFLENYAVGDIMNFDIYYGDGTTENQTQTVSSAPTEILYTLFNHVYALPGTYNVTIMVTGPDGNADTLSIPVTFADTCGNVKGYTYIDHNSNCIFDAGDDVMKHALVDLYDASSAYIATTFTDETGLYSFVVPAGLNYSVSLNVPGVVSPTCPASAAHSFTAVTGVQFFDFGFECTAGFDLRVKGNGACFVPGQDGYMQILAGNYGCTSMPATITLTLDPLVTYMGPTGSGMPPSSVSGSTLTWNFTAAPIIHPIWVDFYTWIHIETSPLAMAGDDVCFTVTITPTSGDANPVNNTHTFCKTVMASYDPNMKEVSPKGIGAEGFVAADQWLDYTVNFQNTGTYQAFNINIVDTIDTHLDMSTFELIGASHAMTPYITGGNIIKFDFPNINLPDSTSNEPESHGFIKYRIKMKPGLADGTEIENTAHIFFDYNPAVITNTTLNTVDISMGVNVAEESKTFMVFPNPSGTYVKINAPGAEGRMAFVYDMTGKLLHSFVLNSTETLVDVSSWTNGLYEIVIPEPGMGTVRFQKMN